MPIHDWTRLEAGDFHDFHQGWVVGICAALNGKLLPSEYFAILERVPSPAFHSEIAQADERIVYAERADRVVIRRGRNKIVAIIEIVSPGNKDSQNALRNFVEKAANILNQGINLLIVDLFPQTPRDPKGLHKTIWDEFTDEPFEAPPGKALTVASYLAGVDSPTAYVEPVGIGDLLPSAPIFLSERRYVPAPLESTYQQAWDVFPSILKKLIEPGH